ncbi:hypothetical protein A1O3_06219 [Capronia epimyces CBS 606.96]|uniref:Uncharacterized protein n=1 Tax=Capronia epimyces CBS 606.96 TaxID=1182542 RepID=W9XZM8_9EURO|nr:uncharacterized protein A1O3_06219 [Capronia epimyces CBS 606.96]EXJ82406.1 hypothetical protein A1O3_06219 [Capronia epimyces CBS 606.96]
MSGFWLDKDKFVTCAHLVGMVTGTDVPSTWELLRKLNLRRAWVSTAMNSVDQDYNGLESWPVYLLDVNSSANIAVFALKPRTVRTKGFPPHSVDLSQLASIYNYDGPEPAYAMSQEGLVLQKSLFAVYYPSAAATVKEAGLAPESQKRAEAAHVEDAWRWMAQESSQDDSRPPPLDYADTFRANVRSVAFGKIKTLDRIPCTPHNISELAHARECSIVGSRGCSGGMVCEYSFVHGAPKAFQVKVIGL